jgi:hypothetical protein
MSHGDQFVPIEVCFEIAILTPCSQDLVGVAGKVNVEFCSLASWTQPVRKHIHKPSRSKSSETVETEGLALDFEEQPIPTNPTVSLF